MSTTASKKVPFVDLKAQYAAIKPEIDAAIQRVIDDTAFILGKEVAAFEREFAAFTGFRHAIGVANGTDAIELALLASGIRAGDEVVAPTHTFLATTEAITQAGGKLRLADATAETFNADAETVAAAASDATKFAVPVLIYGNPAGLDGIVELGAERSWKVIVDAAQAHGVRLHGKKLGEVATTATYSFYPGKNLGAYGDAGAVATNDDEVARLLRMWRNHGREGKFDHRFEAVNSRMDGIQGAILRVKLPHLESWCQRRRDVAGLYREALGGIEGLRLPQESEGAEHVYHLYVVRVCEDRDRLRELLAERNIATGVHYPKPVHGYEAYEYLGLNPGALPVAEELCGEILSLPMYPEMGPEEVDRVARAVRESLAILRG